MFIVDEQTYGKADYERFVNRLTEDAIWGKAERWRIAFCPEDIGEWIMLVHYLKEQQGSIVPIHPSMPFEGAKRVAQEAGCTYLFYQSIELPVVLNEVGTQHESGLVQFSSGTTGEPKRIVRSWSSIEQELSAYRDVWADIDVDTVIVACPVTHSYGLISGVLAGIEQGKNVVIVTTQNPKYVLAQTLTYPNHVLYAAPPLLHMLAKLTKQKLNGVMTSGTRLPDKWFRIIQAASRFIMQQYGCSEVGCISVATNVSHPDEMGKPLSHYIVEAGTQEQPAVIEVQRQEGRCNTGDLGFIDQNGTLYFVERVSDVMIVAGANVYPHEVERVLMQHEQIEDAVVYKKVDSLSGDRVCAQVVASDLEESNVRNWCATYLAPYQIPKEIHFVDAIKKGANGKINRKQIGGGTL